MVNVGSFARDWQLIKLSRSWQPQDIAGEVLRRLMKNGSGDVRAELKETIYSIGIEDGAKFRERIPARSDAGLLVEGFFLIAGISCTVEGEGPSRRLFIKKECGHIFKDGECSDEIAAHYLSGYIRGIAPGAVVLDEGDYFIVDLGSTSSGAA